jgi:hypothetical protein
MARTITEVQAELDTVNAALQELIAGRRLTQLRIGSGEFARLYQYQELTFDTLKAEQQDLTMELATLESAGSSISFRSNSFVPLTVNKFMR